MSIPEVSKKINPVVNFKDKIYYRVKPYFDNRINPLVSRVKEGFDIKDDIFIVIAIILIGLAGFGLGRLSALEKGRDLVTIKPAQFIPIISTTTGASTKSFETTLPKTGTQVPLSASAMIAGESVKGLLVAAKTGTKYYFPWCSGAARISEANKVWFDSYEAAQKTGLTAAANCPNLK